MFKVPKFVKMILPLEVANFFIIIIGIFFNLEDCVNNGKKTILIVSIIGRSIALFIIIYRIYAYVVLIIEAADDESNKMHIHDKERKIERIIAPAKKFKKRYLIAAIIGGCFTIGVELVKLVILRLYPERESDNYINKNSFDFMDRTKLIKGCILYNSLFLLITLLIIMAINRWIKNANHFWIDEEETLVEVMDENIQFTKKLAEVKMPEAPTPSRNKRKKRKLTGQL